ncbi:hypothetical protein [Epilithonimonas sp.]|uniref:hypothetical protein n=1 Tax=Epilithonimonas sp. TaxID=2894511 RepID=UPI0028A9DB20|nr:hypothetical protein [Epilithonimonas sp.]
MGIILYQIGIFIAIQISSFYGRKARNVAIVLIVIFTFLQVFVIWLMLLQFITILLAYWTSKGIIDNNKKKQIENKTVNDNKVNTKASTIYYGTSTENPILMNSVPASYRFLDKIIKENSCLNYIRLGSTTNSNFQYPIDIYEFYKNEVVIMKIYIYPYYNSNIEIVPERLKNICEI